MNDEQYNPELHVNEEPRNDFNDVATGFAVSFGIILVVTVIATLITM